MKLFLTSLAANTLDRIVPLLPKSPQDSSVVFIPTAAGNYEGAPWIHEDKKKLTELGFNVFDLDIKDKTKNEVKKAVKGKDIIFVAGGNTFYLLEHSKKSGFDDIVRELVKKGVIYIGSSAGSVIVGPDIKPVEAFDDPAEAELDNTSAFNLVDFVVLPHYKKEKYGSEHENVIKKYGEKYKLIPLTDEEMIIVEDNSYQIVS